MGYDLNKEEKNTSPVFTEAVISSMNIQNTVFSFSISTLDKWRWMVL